MSKKSYLEQLREENNGYNPERLEDHHNLKLVKTGNDYIELKNKETGELEHWTKSRAESEAEFIERWPRTFALIHKDRFYYKAS